MSRYGPTHVLLRPHDRFKTRLVLDERTNAQIRAGLIGRSACGKEYQAAESKTKHGYTYLSQLRAGVVHFAQPYQLFFQATSAVMDEGAIAYLHPYHVLCRELRVTGP